MYKLFYGEILLAEVMANHSMSIEDIIESQDIDMDEFARQQGWDDWDYEELRIVIE